MTGRDIAYCSSSSRHRTVRTIAAAITFLVFSVASVTWRAAGVSTQAHAASTVPWEFKGATIASYAQDELASSNTAASLQQLARTGANSVTFVVTWYQDNTYSASIYRTGNTASDTALVTAMNEARALGLKVIIKPHVDTSDGQWRARIRPCAVQGVQPCPAGSDLTSTWFSSYDAMMNHYADLAQQYGAAVLSVGAELIDLSTNAANTSQWRTMIAGVRTRFTGKLTYSANWGNGMGDPNCEYIHLPFWDALDYIGISAYFPLASTTTPAVSDMVARWVNTWQPQIAAVQQQWGKPVLFIEGGYRSATGTAQQPFDNWDNWPLNTQEQADCYQATFQAWATVPWFAGEQFWNWETDPNVSSSNTGYSVQNKPAQTVVTNWFGGPTAGGSSPPTATNTPVPPTATNTPVPPTATNTPVPPTATNTPVPVTGGATVNLASYTNNVGISMDGTTNTASFDGDGYSFSAQTLAASGFTPGSATTIGGIPFLWPNVSVGSPDNVIARGQAIALPSGTGGSTLAILGVAAHGAATGTATIQYGDGSTQSFTLGMSDWALDGGGTAPLTGNTIAAILPYRNSGNGGRQSLNMYLFVTTVPLQVGKAVVRVTLPTAINGSSLHLFAITVASPSTSVSNPTPSATATATSAPLATATATSGSGTGSGSVISLAALLNNAGTSSDNAVAANFDDGGYSYSAQALQAAGIVRGQTIVVNGVRFLWPNAAAGSTDNVIARGQTVSLPAGTAGNQLAILGAATHGAATGTATVTYSDGTTVHIALGLSDWTLDGGSAQPLAGDIVASRMSYRDNGIRPDSTGTYVFYAAAPLQAGKTVSSITLPAALSWGGLHIFAMTVS